MIDKNEIAIIIQGPSINVDELKNRWFGFNIIWSTWIGEERKYRDDDIVIFNTVPSDKGVQNIALQKESTLNGIKKAKELGFKWVLKWRSDMIPNDSKSLIDSFKKDSINFLAWHNEGKYFVDYFIGGNIDDIYKIWDVPTIWSSHSEKITTDNIFSLGYNNFNFIGDELNTNNEIYWSKYNINLSTYKNEKCYTMEVK